MTAIHQIRYESLIYWRNRRRVFFTFALPLMFVVVFAVMEENEALAEFGGRRYLTFFIPGILAFGVIFTTFTSMASALAVAREQGVLKRVRGTPISTGAYVAGQVGATFISTALITVVVIALGAVFGADVPWHALPGIASAIAVGAVAFAALGFGVAGFAKTAESAPLMAMFMVLPLSFLSGVWGPPPEGVLLDIAGLFPVRMLVDALQHAYDPNVTGAAISPRDLVQLAGWGIVGVWLSARFLRQERANG
ncbi:MAG TPA: ABC transporter permease [Solirubrobacteraceae bacterium]